MGHSIGAIPLLLSHPLHTPPYCQTLLSLPSCPIPPSPPSSAAGTRLIDEMLAKTSIGSCADFKVAPLAAPHRTAPRSCIDVLWQETVQVIARVGFKMFLNVNANVTAMNLEGTECK
jgi:hypothetical protein